MTYQSRIVKALADAAVLAARRAAPRIKETAKASVRALQSPLGTAVAGAFAGAYASAFFNQQFDEAERAHVQEAAERLLTLAETTGRLRAERDAAQERFEETQEKLDACSEERDKLQSRSTLGCLFGAKH